MPCRLILNADDFGLTRGVNRAIAELYEAGAITSATLMATGGAFDDAVRLAGSLPMLGVGCHVVLVDGAPACPPGSIRSLLGSDGKGFRPTLGGFVRDLLLGRILEGEMVREAEAQIRRVQAAGVSVTHVDTHKHTHMFPAVARAVMVAAQRCGVAAIRNPFEAGWSAGIGREKTGSIRLLQVAALRRLEPAFLGLLPADGAVLTTKGTLGIAATGMLDGGLLLKLFEAASTHGEDGGVYELVCHPGYDDGELAGVKTRLRQQREVERVALLAGVGMAGPSKLIHYGDV